MLRTLRRTLAIIFFALITLLFLDFTGTLHAWFGWLARIQLLPAFLAVNFGIVILLLLLTFLFGRIYCSVICPLGVLQDISAWEGKRGKKLPYSYSPAITWLRYVMLAVFIVALVAGVSAIFTLIEPYSMYGRIASTFFAPIYGWGNNVLAYFAERFDSYAFYRTEVWIRSGVVFFTALITLLIMNALAYRNGRTWCNTVCPVGTLLGFVSRFSIFRPVIDTSACNSCGVCARSCKAACIDSKNHRIDYSRCVTCFDCINKCSRRAIRYAPVLPKRVAPAKEAKKSDASRRSFLTIGAGVLFTSALKAQEQKVDGGFIDLETKRIPNRKTPIVSPGAWSLAHFKQHCTACHLCVSVCPNQVLRPATELTRFMQPELSYERGYCRPECTRCSEVCPTSAIKKIDVAEKSSIQIGRAIWIKDSCVVIKDGVNCNTCARRCPVGAIQMVAFESENPESRRIPAVDVERCIGCGACENLCPARPYSAIYVEGNQKHRMV